MFIDQIKIEGFKTFGNATILGPFFPGINLFVGYNGSGKTSILDAIEFVLGDDYETLTKQQFDELNCHDTKKEKNFISVEIIYDNSDQKYDKYPRKFSIIRKTTNATDSYIVNGKKLSRKKFLEVIDQLEINVSALKQSSVIRFARLSDQQRLDQLFRMIGYQKIETLKHDKWDVSVQKRNDLMIEVNKVYDKLEKEHNMCEELRKVLKKKELIIYGMEKKKMMKTMDEIQQLEMQFMEWIELQRNKTPKYMQIKSELDMLESQLAEANDSLQALESTKAKLTTLIRELENQKSDLEVSILNHQENDEEREHILKIIKEELKSLEKDMTLEEKNIQSLKLELSSATANARKLEIKYGKELCELDSLTLKLSQDNLLVNKEDREELLRRNINALRQSIAEKQKYLKNYQHKRQQRDHKIIELNNKISLIKAEINNLNISQQNNSKELTTCQRKINIATNLSKAVATEKAEASERLCLLENNCKNNCKKLSSAVKCDVIYNKHAVESVLESLNNDSKSKRNIDVSKYHGFVVDCYEYLEAVEPAILAVAGKYLFNFVFEHGKDASVIAQNIKDVHNLALMSLDLLKIRKKNLPQSDDTIPLIDQIKYPPVYQKLIQYMFGNVIICRDNQVALNFCTKYKITCVTTKGSVFYPNGISETGNWNENERNQISIYKAMVKQQEEIKRKEKEIKDLGEKELTFNNTVSDGLGKISILELKLKDNEERRSLLKNELDTLEFQLRCITTDDDDDDADDYEEIVNFIETLTERVATMESKLDNDDEEQMTSQEHQRYRELETSTKNLMKLWKEEESKVVELNKKITVKLNMMEECHLKKKNDLEKRIQEALIAREKDTNHIKNDITNLESKIKILHREYQKLEKVEIEIEKLQIEIENKTEIKKVKDKKAESLKIEIDNNDIEMESLKAQCNDLNKIIEEAQRKMDDVPNLSPISPDSELRSIEEMTLKQLASLEATVNNQLKRMAHDVNENASEMFSRMQEALNTTKDEINKLEADRARVRTLAERQKAAYQEQVYIELLDINEHLKYVVQKFMPDAQVEFLLITANREYTVGEARNHHVDIDDSVVGASIRFAESKEGRVMNMNELSGGQSSILALALILAIQKCFKVSVLLCDEIDQALDCPNRQVLNEIFKTIISEGQIFLTTFKSELVDVGDHLYLVAKEVDRKTSSMKEVNKEEALKFIKSMKQPNVMYIIK